MEETLEERNEERKKLIEMAKKKRKKATKFDTYKTIINK